MFDLLERVISLQSFPIDSNSIHAVGVLSSPVNSVDDGSLLRRIYVAHGALRADYVTVTLTLLHADSGRVMLCKDFGALRVGTEVFIGLCLGGHRLGF